MSLQNFINQAISPWMNEEGPNGDIVLSSRIRLARNLKDLAFPTLGSADELEQVIQLLSESVDSQNYSDIGSLELIRMDAIGPVEKRVLVEKHLISPNLADTSELGAVILSKSEKVSIMVNEEDHIRIQCLFPGLQLSEALRVANEFDDWIEEKVDFAFDERKGYLTSCPTNVGTGLRASVMLHLPALVLTNQINRIILAINQLGLVVRGIYGEGSEAQGNIFQISNQITLGKSEQDIVDDLGSVVAQVINQERVARDILLKSSRIQLEDKLFRSYAILAHSRIIPSNEASQCLSDLRLAIDLGFIENVPRSVLNELMTLTQPGFLQQFSGKKLSPDERDVRRATLIRERLNTINGESDNNDVW